MTQKAGYLLRNEGMGGIRLSKSSVQMLDIVALLLRMRRVNSALTLIFRKKSNLINGKSSLGDGWSNVPSPGSTIPDVSAKIMRFPSLLLRLWLKSPISIPYSSAYEYSFLGGQNGIISNCCFDKGQCTLTSPAHYQPNTDFLNQVIQEWKTCGIQFYGLFHSHYSHDTRLSLGVNLSKPTSWRNILMRHRL